MWTSLRWVSGDHLATKTSNCHSYFSARGIKLWDALLFWTKAPTKLCVFDQTFIDMAEAGARLWTLTVWYKICDSKRRGILLNCFFFLLLCDNDHIIYAVLCVCWSPKLYCIHWSYCIFFKVEVRQTHHCSFCCYHWSLTRDWSCKLAKAIESCVWHLLCIVYEARIHADFTLSNKEENK